MADIKTQLIGIMEDNHVGERNRERLDTDAAADAIIAALPSMVKPLEWDEFDYGEKMVSKCGTFVVTKNWDDGWTLRSSSVPEVWCPDWLAAVMVAQAYQTSRTMSAIGLK